MAEQCLGSAPTDGKRWRQRCFLCVFCSRNLNVFAFCTIVTYHILCVLIFQARSCAIFCYFASFSISECTGIWQWAMKSVSQSNGNGKRKLYIRTIRPHDFPCSVLECHKMHFQSLSPQSSHFSKAGGSK